MDQFNPLDLALANYIGAYTPKDQYNGPIAGYQAISSIPAMGMNAIQNMGGQIGNAFGAVNQLNSQNVNNAQNRQLQLELQQMQNNQQNNRLAAMQPLIAALSGNLLGAGGGGGGLSGIATNYGAGVNYGPQQYPFGRSAEDQSKAWQDYLGQGGGGKAGPAMGGGGGGGTPIGQPTMMNPVGPGADQGGGAGYGTGKANGMNVWRMPTSGGGRQYAQQVQGQFNQWKNNAQTGTMAQGYEQAKPIYAQYGTQQALPYQGYQSPEQPQMQLRNRLAGRLAGRMA